MKKLLIVLVTVFALSMLTGCLNTANHYTKEEVDLLLQEKIDAIAPTQEQRYLYEVVRSMFPDGSIQFAQVGDRVTGSVAGMGYSYIVVELDVATTVALKMNVVAPDKAWDLKIYFGGLMGETDLLFEYVEVGDVYRVTLQAGFNTIAFDSYEDVRYSYIVEILSVL